LRSSAHSLAGACAAVGAFELERQARALEQAARAGASIDAVAVQAQEIDARLRRFTRELDEALAAAGTLQ
ncbi:MAG: Hpt domain-containing protein, partial [Burkholderiales bacterium]|nr:Hpt domain-containing protein [Burkholderiales bacterium]